MAALGALLAHVLIDFNDHVDVTRAGHKGTPSLVQCANFLRVIPDDGLSLRDIALAGRVSRRAINSRQGMNSAWIDRGSAASTRARWRLTEAGGRAREAGEQRVAVADKSWRRRTGRQPLAELREAAEAFVSGLELELSHYPMPYGPADGRAAGGGSVPAKPGPPRIPAHGAEWTPVLRGRGDTVSGLPLYALVSQAYVAFQIDYEQLSGASVFDTGRLARAFPTPRVFLTELPAHLGVDGSGKGSFERHGIVRVEEDRGSRTAVLTDQGLAQVEGHDARLQAIVDDWRDRYGGPVVDDLHSALEGVDARLPSDLPDHCVVRQWHDISRVVK